MLQYFFSVSVFEMSSWKFCLVLRSGRKRKVTHKFVGKGSTGGLLMHPNQITPSLPWIQVSNIAAFHLRKTQQAIEKMTSDHIPCNKNMINYLQGSKKLSIFVETGSYLFIFIFTITTARHGGSARPCTGILKPGLHQRYKCTEERRLTAGTIQRLNEISCAFIIDTLNMTRLERQTTLKISHTFLENPIA